MSRTYKDKKVEYRSPTLSWTYGTELVEYSYPAQYTRVVRAMFCRVKVAGAKPKRKRSFVHPEHYWHQTTPSWWVREFMTAPKRAACRNWAKNVVKSTDVEDVLDCPDYGRKPHVYFY